MGKWFPASNKYVHAQSLETLIHYDVIILKMVGLNLLASSSLNYKKEKINIDAN